MVSGQLDMMVPPVVVGWRWLAPASHRGGKISRKKIMWFASRFTHSLAEHVSDFS